MLFCTFASRGGNHYELSEYVLQPNRFIAPEDEEARGLCMEGDWVGIVNIRHPGGKMCDWHSVWMIGHEGYGLKGDYYC